VSLKAHQRNGKGICHLGQGEEAQLTVPLKQKSTYERNIARHDNKHQVIDLIKNYFLQAIKTLQSGALP